MSFMDSLAANPTGSSGVYGASSRPDDTLSIVNQLRDRDMSDFKEKANFMSDLSLRQDRLKTLFDPEQQRANIQGNADLMKENQPGAGMSTVVAPNPNTLTGYQKGELGIRQQEANTESQRLAQTGKLGQEALNIKTDQEKLNQQKSDQINVLKQQDMERKVEEANKKIELAQKALEDKTKNAEQQLQAHKDLAAAVEERHKIELANKEYEFKTTSAQHAQQIKDMEQRLKDAENTHQVKYDAQGNKITTDTTRGDSNSAPVKNADGTYTVTKGGVTGIIPADKLDDWMKNHAP